MSKLVLRLHALPRGSLSEQIVSQHVVDLAARAQPAPPAAATPASSPALTPAPLARWCAVAAGCHDACLVVDADGRVVSLSESAGALLGCGTDGVPGRPLLSLLTLVDFHSGASSPEYAERIAPLAVLQDGAGLVRSLLRVRHVDDRVLTIDAAGAPLHDGNGRLIGSFTLLAALGS